MGGFIFFLFLIFFVIPAIKNAAGGGKSAKGNKKRQNARRELAAKMAAARQTAQNKQKNPWGGQSGQKNKHGHSDDRQRTHENLHRRDSNEDVFPAEHLMHVTMRQKRDKAERARMEETIHHSENKAIKRTGNKGVDNWGARGDGIGNGGGFVVLVLGALAAYFVISNYYPDMLG